MQFPTLSLLAAVVIYKLQRNQSLISRRRNRMFTYSGVFV